MIPEQAFNSLTILLGEIKMEVDCLNGMATNGMCPLVMKNILMEMTKMMEEESFVACVFLGTTLEKRDPTKGNSLTITI